jgi:hypothetical protein
MSTIEELESELKTIKKQISERKLIANKLKLPGKVFRVAEFYGNLGKVYSFSEKGLVITCEADYDHVKSPYMTVNLGTINSIVFIANLHKNDVGQIHLYSPGDWEKRIEKLYNEIPEKQRKREISYLQNRINDLKKKWNLGEIL